jgi:hypothetical protein
MKTLFTFLAFAFLNLTAHAGQELDKVNQDIDTYFLTQALKPNEIIKYADEYGFIAKAVLNPERIQKIINDAKDEKNGAEQISEVLVKFISISSRYDTAFHKFHGQYDAEYLDAFEIVSKLTMHGLQNLQLLSRTPQTNESTTEALGVLATIASTMQKAMYDRLAKDIADSKFSVLYTSIAEKRLDKLREEFSPK